MPSLRATMRRRRLPVLAAVLAAIAALTYSLVAGAAAPIPVPDPLVVVTTKSGNVTKEHLVPIGGAPVPIDVDNPGLTGVLEPDIDVSVGLVSIPELPDVPVPNVVVRRNALALATDRPNPPLDINAKVVLRDAADGLKPLVEVNYGFATPPGGRIPPVVEARLVGPVEGGFVDPLQAKILSPGYSGPLNFKISALTNDLDAKFQLDFDALPESIFISEDPREDGLDVLYQHQAPVADVHLDAFATLRNRQTNEKLEVGANIERLPQEIKLSNTNTSDTTFVTYDSSSSLSKPDIEARYTDTDGDGDVVTDANVKVAGLPFAMEGRFDFVPAEGGGRDVDAVDFNVLDGDDITSADFEVRNFSLLAPVGNLPSPTLQPEQYVAVASRRIGADSTRFRAAGRLLGIRGFEFERQGDDNKTIDATTDMGNGVRPLRAIVDIDDRGPGADADAQRMKINSLLTPLPRNIHLNFDPSGGGTEPTRLLYESSSVLDADVDAIIAGGSDDGCGDAEVTCAKVRIDKIPSTLLAVLPGEDGTDFSLSHDGSATQKPDVRATVDDTALDEDTNETSRTWADIRLLRVPNEITGRLDTTTDGVLRAAEFHACKWDFAADPPACTDAQGAIGRVQFTVRGRPDRTGLPSRPDVADQHVILLNRQDSTTTPELKAMEVVGRVDEVRNVEFRQRDTVPDDEQADGTLGAVIDVGSNKPEFDLRVDDESDAINEEPDPDVVIGRSKTKVAVNVEELPPRFTTCFRDSKEEAPVGGLPDDDLLEPCELNNIVTPAAGEHPVTPLSAHYTATDEQGQPHPTKVTANVKATAPDLEDKDSGGNPIDATDVLDLVLDKVPAELRADLIPPITPDPDANPAVAGRRLQLVYDASDSIDLIKFGMENRRATDICEDPRPNRNAMCLSGDLHDLPSRVEVSYDPDDAKGDIAMTTAPPPSGDPKLSIKPFRLSKVSPEKDSSPLILDAEIEGVSDKIAGKIQSFELDGESPPGSPTLPAQLATCDNAFDDDGDGKTDVNDEDCEKDPARLAFNACPPGSPSGCVGIDKITFTATNSLVGDPLPPVPAANPATGGDQEFSFMAVGDDFRAKGLVRNLKELSYSKLEDLPSDAPSRVTSLRSAFGNGTPLRAYVDRDTGTETQVVDAVIKDAPEAINICLRDKTNIADTKTSGGNYCEKRDPNGDGRDDHDKLALQTRLDTVATGTLPDIDLRRFEMTKGGGAEVLKAFANIEDLAERIDVLAGKGDDLEVLVEGRTLGGTLSDVARRVTFGFQNFDSPTGSSFPWGALDGGTEPESASRNQDPSDGNRHNYLKVIKDQDGRVKANGSVPRIKRIQLEPRPCDPPGSGTTGDERFPDPNVGFAANQKPDYKCVRAIVAPGRKLGLAVRTLDEKNEILSVEEGHISKMPDSLTVALGKAPDTIKLAPVCADADNNGDTDVVPCNPPMLSVEAPTTGSPGQLDARLAVGSLNLNNTLRTKQPDDPLSQRLDYEERPALGTFPRGARVKVGTAEGGGLALRLGLKVNIPKFLDLDPPILYDCSHKTATPGPNCDEQGVGKPENTGHETKDIFFSLVAADDKHGGNPADNGEAPETNSKYLGRVALMVEPITPTDGTQIVLTGMPDPDHQDPIAGRSTQGASSKFAEDFPSTGDVSNKGFLAPAHLDTQVFMRNDFNAVKDGRNSNSFTQIDGRVNAPLSMAVRLNERKSNDPDKAKKWVSPERRDGVAVSPTQISLRNAPSSNNTDNYGDPTFRVRAQVNDAFQEDSDPGIIEKIFTCNGDGYGIEIPALFTFCALLPVNAESRYLDVQLNADPNKPNSATTSTGAAARRVDAVAGPFGSKNDAELKGYTTINGNTPANITPVAALRLTNFNLGLKIGGGFLGLVGGSTTYEMVGDLVLGLAGHANDRTRISSNLATMRLISEGGADPNDFARVLTDLEAVMRFKITAEALFGLISEDIIDETTPPFHQPIEFQACSATGLLGFEFPSFDEFWTGDANNFLFADAKPGNRKATIGFGVPASFAGQANQFNIMLSQLLQPLWCVFGTNDGSMGDPAPGYTNNNRLLPGQTSTANTSTTPTPAPVAPADDLTVPASTAVTMCGFYNFDEVTVDGDINVAASGNDPQGHPCNGSLDLRARKVTLGTDGDIRANNIMGSGAGSPGGVGGGAGHHGNGGQSGRNKTFANQGPGGSSYPVPAGGSVADFGSRGRDGDSTGGAAPDADVPGGRGGGTVRIIASDRVILNGNAQITANGQNGDGVTTRSGNLCNTGGGGGSGGAIDISANIVDGDGTIEAAGGNGGPSGYGGGGGSGGRITINAIADDIPNSKTITDGGNGGTNGGASGDCDTGAPNVPFRTGDGGGNGTELAGSDISHAANAELHPDTPGPFANGNVKVRVTGIDHNDGPLELVLCRRAVPWSDDDPFADAGLDPSGNADVSQLTSGAICTSQGFSSHNTGSFEYVHTFDLNLSSDVYGFFAYSRRPVCVSGTYLPSVGLCSDFSSPVRFNQTPLPGLATAKIGVDKGQPGTSPITARDGETGCPSATAGDSLCLTSTSAGIDVNWSDNESGVTAVECRVNRGATVGTYGDCKARPTTLTLLGEGENWVDVRVFDQAGNVSEVLRAVEWFVDTTAPNKPVVSVTPVGAQKNGWYTQKPLVGVSATDNNPSSGFEADKVTLFVDEAEVPCGTAAAGSVSTSGTTLTTCTTGSTAASIPEDGIHTFTAHSEDRVGHKSETSDAKQMKVDAKRPTSRFFIGPKEPDGDNGWYVTKPFLAFAASDSAGGSGVDSSLDVDNVGAGVTYSINGGTPQEFDPNNSPVLPDGIHDVCFFARDLAGNREDADGNEGNGLQDQCVNDIKVDSTPPTIDNPVTPTGPDGDNGWYKTTPTTDAESVDPAGAASASERSGVAKKQIQVDEGPWVTAAPTDIAEGEHVVRTRAFDGAGNPSPITERRIFVDKTDPSSRLVSFPPQPNEQGWFRRLISNSVAAFDGRDGSGADGATFQVNAEGPAPYLEPFGIPDGGFNQVTIQARDFAGRKGAKDTRLQHQDRAAPYGAPVGRTPILTLPAIGLPRPVPLVFTASDEFTPRVRVQVFVYNTLGGVVRRLTAAGTFPGGYRSPGQGSVGWDGRDERNRGVPPGVYHYRVHVTDQAGNTVLSDESPTFLVVLGVLPL